MCFINLSLCLSWDWCFGQQRWTFPTLSVCGYKPGCLQCHNGAQLPGYNLFNKICPESHDWKEEGKDHYCEQCDGSHGSSSCLRVLCQQACSAGKLHFWDEVLLCNRPALVSAVAEDFVPCRKHKSPLKLHTACLTFSGFESPLKLLCSEMRNMWAPSVDLLSWLKCKCHLTTTT